MADRYDEDDMANLKARCKKLELALKTIWTWAHCAETDPSPYKTQLKRIEKKVAEVLE